MTEVAKASPHADALETALRSVIGGFRLYVDQVPAVPIYPYVVLFTDAGVHADDSLGLQVEHATFHPVVVSVARDDARFVHQLRDRVMQVLATEVIVPGRDCRLTSLSSNPVARDEDVPDRVVFFGRDLFRLDSWAN